MALRTLNAAEKAALSELVERINTLHQKTIANNHEGYSYEWARLSKLLNETIDYYKEIISNQQ